MLGGKWIALPPERHGMRVGVIANPVAFVVRPRRKLPAFRVGQLFSDHEERAFDAPCRKDVQHARRHAGLGAIVEGQGQIEHESEKLHHVAGCRAPAETSSARWPPRVPVCQIAALRSSRRIAALNATAIASTKSTPANTCG